MPTKILDGPAGQEGRGCKVCTLTGGTLLHPAMKLGPDRDKWELYSEDEIVTLTTEVTRYQHVSVAVIDHLCAQKSRWAFTVFESSLPHAVAFLHIEPPRKLKEAMADGNINVFSGADILRAYRHAKDGSRAPRLWRRKVTGPSGWDEIAVNFCVKA